ncbi:hypothetical protein [Paenibacillus xanthanilyticus]|uniref:Tetratricopeptide repeat protein n=1 Tax=Paenibacillus xanthanilyticus TaxID=1783531 RepID=A0ABV8JZD3_9BACL
MARNPEKDHSFEDVIYAGGLLAQGKYAEARKLLLASVQADDSHRFVGNLLAAELLLTDGFDSAIALAELHPQHAFGQITPKWLKQIRDMKEEAIGKSDYQTHLRQAIEWHYGGNEAKLKSWQDESNEKAMIGFLRMLKEVY